MLPHLYNVPDPIVWSRVGIQMLNHLFLAGEFCTFDLRKEECDLPNWYFFRYHQLRHVIRVQPQAPKLQQYHSESLMRAVDLT